MKNISIYKKSALAAVAVLCASSAQAITVLNFIIDGDTFSLPYQITNSSTAGESVVAFHLDLLGTGTVFDTVTGGIPNATIGVPFTPLAGTGVSTGLTSPATVADGSTVLDLAFSDFGPGEFFRWDIDVDFSAGGATVFGNNLIGATAWADFSDGQRLFGVLGAVPGNPDAAAFTVTGRVQTPPPGSVPDGGTTLALLGLSLAGLGGLHRKFKK